MANEKKMYVIQADDGMFFCGLKYWDKQLRKAKIYHSLHYAMDVADAYEQCNCKIRWLRDCWKIDLYGQVGFIYSLLCR